LEAGLNPSVPFQACEMVHGKNRTERNTLYLHRERSSFTSVVFLGAKKNFVGHKKATKKGPHGKGSRWTRQGEIYLGNYPLRKPGGSLAGKNFFRRSGAEKGRQKPDLFERHTQKSSPQNPLETTGEHLRKNLKRRGRPKEKIIPLHKEVY